MNHREETQAVKKALLEAGIPVKRVKHGTGTASSWLKIYVFGITKENWCEMHNKIIGIVQQVTGRSGEYDGKINIHCAD